MATTPAPPDLTTEKSPLAARHVRSFRAMTLTEDNKKPAEAGFYGAVEKTRTSTGCPTATSTLRVYQFRHDRIVVEPNCSGGLHVAKALGGHKSDMTDFLTSFSRCLNYFVKASI
jgi:hypothetical protein